MYHTQHELILDYMTLSENEGQIGYPMLKKSAELSWYELHKTTKESVIKKWYDVVDGVVKYPRCLEKLLGLYVVDSCGDLQHLDEDNSKSIIPKPKAKCKCNVCDEGECLCPTIQDSIVQADVVIEGVPHTNKTITRVLKNGDIVEESYTWVASFDDGGNFVEAIEIPSHITKCKLDVLSCGCTENCEANIIKLSRCGCIFECFAPYMRLKYPAVFNMFGYYKNDEENRQIFIFDSDGRKSMITQVEVVFQSNGEGILIKDYARKAFIALLDYTRKMYSPNFTETQIDYARRNWNRVEYQLIRDLNPIPYELFMGANDATKKVNKRYLGVHSDFINKEPAPACCPAQPAQNITNIIQSVGPTGLGVLKLVVDAGAGHPVSGVNTFQRIDLVGWGNLSGDKVTFTIEKTEMKNWGNNPDFTFDKALGEMTFTGDYVWQAGDAVTIDKNQ